MIRTYKDKIISEIESLPEEYLYKLYDIIHYLKLGYLYDKNQNKQKDDPLSNLDDIVIDTGIKDLAENHDHYLYGVNKE
jgi:hypothetical protein